MTDHQHETFAGFAILELMGHRKLAGLLSEQEIAGQAFIRIDVPHPNDSSQTIATQFYSAAAVYAITPTTEEIARSVASGHQPQPVTRWELQALEARSSTSADDPAERWDDEVEPGEGPF